MEDVTDTVFRRIVASCGRPDVFFTEFTSCDGLFSKGRESVIGRLAFTEEERPLVAQIWGLNPENYRRSAELLADLGFDGIDINMGCPVPKIIKKGACAGLIENPALAKEIYLATCEGAKGLPVSIKTRLGFRKIQTEEWAGFLLELDPAVLTIHGRVAKHMSKYPANWEEIGKVVALRNQMQRKTLIVGNGDVRSSAEAMEKHRQYGVEGVMIARGVFNNLCVFNNDPQAIAFPDWSVADKLDYLKRHVALCTQTWGEQRYRALKKFFKIYISNFENATELRTELIERTDTVAEMNAVLARWEQQSNLLM
jgi:tRNA-dihydrouridine synthase